MLILLITFYLTMLCRNCLQVALRINFDLDPFESVFIKRNDVWANFLRLVQFVMQCYCGSLVVSNV